MGSAPNNENRAGVKPRSKNKKRAGARSAKTGGAAPLDPLRTGMPAMDSITGIETVGRGKKAFRIIHTSEVDQYELSRLKAKQKKK